jgi:hypothetical protein
MIIVRAPSMRRRRGAPMIIVRALALWLICASGCNDLAEFAGAWHGQPLASPTVLAGLPATAAATLTLSTVTRTRLDGTLTLRRAPLGEADARAPLRPLAQAQADTISELSLPDSPLRSYFTAVTLSDGDALAIVTLYDERIDLRLMRSDTLYALFRLSR